MRIKFFKREKATYIKLRRDHHYSITHLAQLFGRSTSVIHRILKTQKLTGQSLCGAGFYIQHTNNPLDNRTGKLRKTNSYVTRSIRKGMYKITQAWLAFALGETDKPP
jgi:hypothetical protein